jgi:hypothetical protein
MFAYANLTPINHSEMGSRTQNFGKTLPFQQLQGDPDRALKARSGIIVGEKKKISFEFKKLYPLNSNKNNIAF